MSNIVKLIIELTLSLKSLKQGGMSPKSVAISVAVIMLMLGLLKVFSAEEIEEAIDLSEEAVDLVEFFGDESQ